MLNDIVCLALGYLVGKVGIANAVAYVKTKYAAITVKK